MFERETKDKKKLTRLYKRYVLVGITFKDRIYPVEQCFDKGFITFSKLAFFTAVAMLKTGLSIVEIEFIVDSYLLACARRYHFSMTGKIPR